MQSLYSPLLLQAETCTLIQLRSCVSVLAGGLIYAVSFALVTGAWIRHSIVSRRAAL